MKKLILQAKVLSVFSLFVMVSCNAEGNNSSILLKNIEKSARESSQENDKKELIALKKKIEEETAKEGCTNPGDWEYAAMGSKSCGGPQFYIAYPKKMKTRILTKIKDYTKKEQAFNKKYNVQSDCLFVSEPTEIICKDGKIELITAQ